MRKDVPVLDLNAFTAGVEPGGLTHGYEIKILVCYLLGQIGTGMTFTQISDALLHRGLVNYFELANALSDLTESGHLTCEDCAGRQEDTSYHLTDLGRQTACTFSGTLPVSVRERLSNPQGTSCCAEKSNLRIMLLFVRQKMVTLWI